MLIEPVHPLPIRHERRVLLAKALEFGIDTRDHPLQISPVLSNREKFLEIVIPNYSGDRGNHFTQAWLHAFQPLNLLLLPIDVLQGAGKVAAGVP